MKTKKSDKIIFNVIWESNVDGEIIVSVYSCNSLEVAKAKFNECKEEALSNGHFASEELGENDYMIDENDRHYFIKDEYAPYYEDIYILESNLFVKSE